MLPSFETVTLPNRLIQLTEAIEAIHNAGHDINYYGGHGDKEAMKAIYRKMKLLDMALINFQRTHGTSLDD